MMRRKRAFSTVQGVIGAALLLSLAAVGMVRANDWPRWRGPNDDGISSETGWLSTWTQAPQIAWKKSIGIGFASMSVSNGRVYATGNVRNNDVVYCFDAVTGQELWKQSYPCALNAKNHEGGPCATPTVQGDAVYVFSKTGDALRLAADDGRIVWHKNLVQELKVEPPTWFFSGSPLLVDDLVIYNAGSAGVALRQADGSVAWQSGRGVSGYATAVPMTIDGQRCIVLMGAKDVFGLNPTTGKVLWRHSWETEYDINAADPILVGNLVFISSGYNKGCAMLKIDGSKVTEVWRNKNMRNQCNSSVLWADHLYGFDGQVGGSGKLTCIDAGTGRTNWAQAGMGTGSLMLADGKLIVLSEKGKLVIAKASPEKFEELASAQILDGKCWTVPVLANGRIYARNADGDLVCVNVSGQGS
jgi:outer membrane protein assembly factor BamB